MNTALLAIPNNPMPTVIICRLAGRRTNFLDILPGFLGRRKIVLQLQQSRENALSGVNERSCRDLLP